MTTIGKISNPEQHELDRLLDDLHLTSKRLAEGRPPTAVRSPAIGRSSMPSRGPLSGRHSDVMMDTHAPWVTNSSLNNRRIQVTPGGSSSSAFYQATSPRQSSVDRHHQSVYSTVLNSQSSSRRSPLPTSPGFSNIAPRGSEITLTIDPNNGISNISNSSSFSRTRHATSSFGHRSSFKSPSNQHHVTVLSAAESAPENRERRLMQELMSTKEELHQLRSSMNTLNHSPGTHNAPYSVGLMVPGSNRPRHYQSQTNIYSTTQTGHQTLSNNHSNYGYAPLGTQSTTLPKRTLSTSNVHNSSSRSWAFKDAHGSQSNVSMIDGGLGGQRNFNLSGYSARRERVRREQEERMLKMQSQGSGFRRPDDGLKPGHSVQTLNHLDSSSHYADKSALYRSMNSMSASDGQTFEEVETITLQPIGRGVQDLESNMGSTTTLATNHRVNGHSSLLDVRTPTLRRATSYDQRKWSFGLGRERGCSSSRLNNIESNQRFSFDTQSRGKKESVKNDTMRRKHFINCESNGRSFRDSLLRRSSASKMQSPRPSMGIISSSVQTPVAGPAPLYRSGSLQMTLGPSNFRSRGLHAAPAEGTSILRSPSSGQSAPYLQEPALDVPDDMTAATTSTLIPQQQAPVSHAAHVVMKGCDNTAETTMRSWYRPKLSRDEAIRILKQQAPGSFLVRDSTSYQNAYGLAVKVAQLPPKVQPKSDDMQSELVRHYLIEAVIDGSQNGVRLKGFTNEPVFPNLSALIQEHTTNQLALPCKLVLPMLEQLNGFRMAPDTHTGNSQMEGVAHRQYSINGLNTQNGIEEYRESTIKKSEGTKKSFFDKITRPMAIPANYTSVNALQASHGVSVRTLFLGQRGVEMLSGEAAVKRCLDSLMPKARVTAAEVDWALANSPPTGSEVAEGPLRYVECGMHLQPGEGITVTDLGRKLFFRRHMPQNTLIYAGLDPRKKEFQHPEHKQMGISKPRIYAIIARTTSGDHTCHIFCDLDPTMSAKEIVNFVNNYMVNRV